MPLTLPTPQDSSLLIQDTTTRTASYNTAGFDLGGGFSPGGLGIPVSAVLSATALDLSSGNETYSVVMEESSDNSSYSAIGAATLISATGAIAVRGWITRRYVRLSLTLGGTSPSITFKAWLNPLV